MTTGGGSGNVPDLMRDDPFQSMIAGLEAAGLSKVAIAERSGLARSTVCPYAAVEVLQPAFETDQRLERVCRLVGLVPPRPTGTQR